MKNKKGQMQAFQALTVSLVAVAIVLAVGFMVLSQVRTSIGSTDGVDCTNFSTDAGGGGTSQACNATAQVQDAVAQVPLFLGIVAITLIGAALITLVTRFMRTR